MFRMEFHSLDAVEEDEDRPRSYTEPGAGSNGHERFRRHSTSSSPPRIHEGRVGKFSKVQRMVSSNEATVSHLPAITITRARSLNAETSIPKNWVEVDLIDFSESPKPAPPTTTSGEQEVIRELVKPFAESVKLTEAPQPVPVIIPDLLSNGVQESMPTPVAVSGSSPVAVSGSSPVAVSGSFPGSSPVRFEDLRVRTDSVRSIASARSENSDTEGYLSGNGSVKDEEKGSPATRSVNKAFNKFMYKKNKGSVPEAKVVKPWDEPLLLAHEQVKMDRKAQKEAKAEAKRLAEEAKREAEFQQRELLELANPVPESSLKNHKEHGVRKGIHKLFHIHAAGIHSTSPSPSGTPHVDVRESKLVMPRASMFDTAAAMMSPSTSDVALAQIRQGPRPSTKSDLTFATVESNQRDVQPWTMEEYMAKNARLAEWEGRDDDEEFGGIENNQLLNQNFDNTAMDTFDSDSD